MAAEQNVITTEQMKKAREIDFVHRFTHDSLDKLFEVLGVTRKIPMQEGTTLYFYRTTGTLQDGHVAEGDIIPLSQYKTEKIPVGSIELLKWRKAVTAEAIKKSGYDAAVTETDSKLLRDVQNSIRTNLFTFLGKAYAAGDVINGAAYSAATGSNLQEALANGWGVLQTLFEDDAVETVYFVNPQDISAYLGKAQITTQTVFGMNYIENFLGLGTVIMSSRITKGTYVATAKDNFIAYFLTMNGDIARAFNLTADKTGFIGMKSGYQNEERAQVESLVMSGVQFLVEYAEGVVKGTITGAEAASATQSTPVGE